MTARGVWTAIGALLLAAVGFAAGGLGSAGLARSTYAEPWQKLRLERTGIDGKPSHTRVVFQNPKLALQAIEVATTAEGAPSSGRVTLREGDELTVDYDEKARPSALTAPDGTVARIAYEGDRTRVTFFAADGAQLATGRFKVPAQLVVDASTGEGASSPHDTRLATIWERATSSLVGEAAAAEAQDEDITVTREVPVGLDLRLIGTDSGAGSAARVETSCAPLVCVPSRRDLSAPGANDLVVTVSGTTKKSALATPSAEQTSAMQAEAKAERKAAGHALPDIARVVGAVAITAMACKSAQLVSPLCIKELASDPGVAGGAVTSVTGHAVESDSTLLEERAKQLSYEEEARALFDKDAHIEVCVGKDGFARVCTQIDGRPFAAAPMAKVARVLELRKGVGGTLVGSFVMSQADGADCKFSPSPRTTGEMRLTFDNEKNTVTASLTANERGSRPNMGCSLGTANMSWSQSYGVTAAQTFTKEQLTGGGKLALRLVGTMSGSGSYSFSNCRTGGGASAGCPAGKTEGYGYPAEIIGSIDLDTHVGSGQIVVSNAPLVTQGTWRVPAEAKP